MNESIGLKFGNLTVLEIVPEKTKAGKTKCKCLCDCGNEHVTILSGLKSGNTKSCGCLKKIDCKTGCKYGMLTIISHKPGDKMVEAICDCGVSKDYIIYNILRGVTNSCGCNRVKSNVGNKYGLLTVIEDYIIKRKGSKDKPVRYCIAQCKCGKIIETEMKSLLTGNTQTCGCISRKSIEMNPLLFSDKNEESMYWAGMLASDGNIYGNSIHIGLKESDLGHIEKLRNWIGVKTKINYKAKTNSYSFMFKNKRMCEDLLEYGVTPRKSLTYTPPLFCEQSPDFWRGMIDGDGHIGKTRPVINLFGTSMACESFQRFVKTFCESKANVRKHGNIFSIRYSGPYAIQIMQKLYGNNPKFYLDRKYELANKFCNFPLADDNIII